MDFPVYFNLFGHRIHPHLVLELIAYTVGFQLYLRTRRRYARAAVPFEQNMWLIVGCVFGALVGSKLLAFVESFDHYTRHLADPRTWAGGKTIVGGLLGGWAGVEFAKYASASATPPAMRSCSRSSSARASAGWAASSPASTTTRTASHTTLPWAVNFGDGPRHPTQLYEIAFLLLLGVALWAWSRRRPRPNGQMFRLFMLGYLGFRFAVEFLKPRETPAGFLSAIQLACLLGGAVCLWQLTRPRDADGAYTEIHGTRPAEA